MNLSEKIVNKIPDTYIHKNWKYDLKKPKQVTYFVLSLIESIGFKIALYMFLAWIFATIVYNRYGFEGTIIRLLVILILAIRYNIDSVRKEIKKCHLHQKS